MRLKAHLGVFVFLLTWAFCIPSYSQPKVHPAGDGWHLKVDSAMQIIKKYDPEKYELLTQVCDEVSFWISNFSSNGSPQEMLNIAGTQWLKKNYVVKVAIIHDGKYYYGQGVRKTTLFAMFLDVEGGEVPLNRKAFSKALESALKKSVTELAKS